MEESPGPVIPALSWNPGTLALFTLANFQPFWIPDIAGTIGWFAFY